jgi:ATP-dependent Lon protease
MGHLFGPLPPEMRDDTAFMDRIHCYLPGWDVPKVKPELFTDHFGLVSDFLSECFTPLRNQSRVDVLQGRVHFGGALSGRDTNAVNKTISGLLKLIHPDPTSPSPTTTSNGPCAWRWKCRRRVKEQQKRIGAAEFRNTHFSYSGRGRRGEVRLHSGAAERGQHRLRPARSRPGLGDQPRRPGRASRICSVVEVTEGPGSGREASSTVPRRSPSRRASATPSRTSTPAPRNSSATAIRAPTSSRCSSAAFDAAQERRQDSASASLIALCSALLRKSVRGGLVVVGGLRSAAPSSRSITRST